jgi:hypothetical protein
LHDLHAWSFYLIQFNGLFFEMGQGENTNRANRANRAKCSLRLGNLDCRFPATFGFNPMDEQVNLLLTIFYYQATSQFISAQRIFCEQPFTGEMAVIRYGR